MSIDLSLTLHRKRLECLYPVVQREIFNTYASPTHSARVKHDDMWLAKYRMGDALFLELWVAQASRASEKGLATTVTLRVPLPA